MPRLGALQEPRAVTEPDPAAMDLLQNLNKQQEELTLCFQTFSRNLQEVHDAVTRLDRAFSFSAPSWPTSAQTHTSGHLHHAGTGTDSPHGGGHGYDFPPLPSPRLHAKRTQSALFSTDLREQPQPQQQQQLQPPQRSSSSGPASSPSQPQGQGPRVSTVLGSTGTDDARSIMRGADNALRVISSGLITSGISDAGGTTSPDTVNLPARKWKKVSIESGQAPRISGHSFGVAATLNRQAVTDSAWFGWICGLIIIADAVLIAVETDDTADRGDVRPVFFILSYLFSVWYVVELGLRIWASTPRIKFFKGKERLWNAFDIFLVTTTVVDLVIQHVNSVRLRAVAIGRVLRALRLFRVIRMLRIVRFMTFLREFHKLVLCLASSVQTLACAMSLVSFVIFCFSVLFVQVVTQHLETGPDFTANTEEEQELMKAFGTVGRSMISLYMAVTAGRNWGELAELLYSVSPALRACFFVYLALMIFGITNVVTAVFVESAMQATQNYRDLLVQEMMLKERTSVKHMKEIFKSIDTDNSGAISLYEMHQFMQDDSLKLQEYFEALDLSASDTQTLFQLLDIDGNGEVDIDEFCDGCMRLGGPAKSFDMNCMWYEQRRTNHEILRFIQHACICLHLISRNSGTMPEKQRAELMRAADYGRQLFTNGPNGRRRSSRSTSSSSFAGNWSDSGHATHGTMIFSNSAFGGRSFLDQPPSTRPDGEGELPERRLSHGPSDQLTMSCLSTESQFQAQASGGTQDKPAPAHFSYQC